MLSQSLKMPLVALLFVVGLVGCRTTDQPKDATMRYAGYRPSVNDVVGVDAVEPVKRREIKAGDPITILVRNSLEEMKVEDIVDGLGMVGLQHIGDIKISGMTTAEAEQHIHNAYVNGQIFRDVVISVIKVENPQDENYYVSGEVNRKGQHLLREGMTLNQAIVAAGDFTEWGKMTKVKLTRDGKSTYYDVKKIRENRQEDPVIQSGDQIHVR